MPCLVIAMPQDATEALAPEHRRVGTVAPGEMSGNHHLSDDLCRPVDQLVMFEDVAIDVLDARVRIVGLQGPRIDHDQIRLPRRAKDRK